MSVSTVVPLPGKGLTEAMDSTAGIGMVREPLPISMSTRMLVNGNLANYGKGLVILHLERYGALCPLVLVAMQALSESVLDIYTQL